MVTKGTLLNWGYWLALGALLVYLGGWHHPDSDEGFVLEGAWGLLQGRALYTEVFQYVPPGSFYALFWIWKAFGAHYFLAEALGIISLLLTAAAIFRTGALLGGMSPACYFGPLLYCLASVMWPAINHNTFNAVFLSWALYFCTKGISTRSHWDFAAAGLFTGLSMLFLLHKGAAVFAVVLVFLLTSRDERPIRLRLTFALFSLVPLLLLLHWPLPLLMEDLVKFPMQHYLAVNQVSSLPLAVGLCCTALVCFFLKDSLSRQVTLIFLVQMALFATALQRTDWSHTLVVLFPLLSLLPLAHEKAENGTRFMRHADAWVTVLAAFAAIIPVMAVSFVRMSPHEGEHENRLIDYLDSDCPSFYAGPFLPGLYYEAKKRNPVSFSVLLTGFNTVAQFKSAAMELRASPPRCAVVDYAMVRKFGYSRQNPVDRFIMENYMLSRTYGEISVYVLGK